VNAPALGGEILFLGHRIPFPPNRGDKIRSHHILRGLADLAPVHVACFADDADDRAEEGALAALSASYCLVDRTKPLPLAGLQALGQGKPISMTAFYDRRIADYVATVLAAGRIGTIFGFSSQMAQYIPDSFAGRVIFDFVDVDSVKFEAYAAQKSGPMAWVHGREARLLRAWEAKIARRCDLSLLVSEKEADLFRERLPAGHGARVEALGNGIDTVTYDPALVKPEPRMAQAGAPRLIFTGQMDYPPNIDAVIRAARRILPLVRQSLPDATFHIVGRSPTDAVKALASLDGVHVWGRVDDVLVWLRGADMALCPLDIARGVQNKVLEAMAMALPVVASQGAATGIPAQPNTDFIVEDSDEALAKAIVALAQDPDAAARMGQSARRFVVERQSWAAALAPLASMLAHAG